MLRSPISLPSLCTSAISSERNALSADESDAAFEIFFPGILTPNHQSKKNTPTTASAMRRPLSNTRRNIADSRSKNLSYLFPKAQGAEHEEHDRHDDQNH